MFTISTILKGKTSKEIEKSSFDGFYLTIIVFLCLRAIFIHSLLLALHSFKYHFIHMISKNYLLAYWEIYQRMVEIFQSFVRYSVHDDRILFNVFSRSMMFEQIPCSLVVH